MQPPWFDFIALIGFPLLCCDSHKNWRPGLHWRLRMDHHHSSGMILNQYELGMLMKRTAVIWGLSVHLPIKKHHSMCGEATLELHYYLLLTWFLYRDTQGLVALYFSFSACLKSPFSSSDSQIAWALRPLCYMLVKVVPLTWQSKSKCQNVCRGQTLNACNYVQPYAVYGSWVWKSRLNVGW